jgi:hypothetical protein
MPRLVYWPMTAIWIGLVSEASFNFAASSRIRCPGTLANNARTSIMVPCLKEE